MKQSKILLKWKIVFQDSQGQVTGVRESLCNVGDCWGMYLKNHQLPTPSAVQSMVSWPFPSSFHVKHGDTSLEKTSKTSLCARWLEGGLDKKGDF